MRPNTEAEFWSHVDRRGDDECWPWTRALQRRGYGQFKVAGKARNAHRWAYTFAVGDPGDLLVCHRCDNPPCCNPTHLFLGTSAENQYDKIAKGRQARGAGHGRAVLRPDQVATIRQLCATGRYSQRAIGAAYGVSQLAVSNIVTGRTWVAA